MRRFDVYRNPNPRSARAFPYLVVLQSELLDEVGTHVVAPLVRSSALTPMRRLNPKVVVEGHDLFLLTQQLGPVSTRALAHHVTNLEAHRSAITAALDFLFSGI